MFKAILILVLVAGAVFGGLFYLRNSGRAGMPSQEVLKRASKRTREQDAADQQDP
jgi:hypothetical protein